MNVPENLRYQDSHEWISTKEDELAVGVTDHAQEELTDIVFVELPEVGMEVAKGDPVCVVESVKAASDIYSPASGTITAVNEALESEPALVNTDPYGEGWLFRLEGVESSELETLLDPEGYKKVIG